MPFVVKGVLEPNPKKGNNGLLWVLARTLNPKPYTLFLYIGSLFGGARISGESTACQIALSLNIRVRMIDAQGKGL